MFKSVIYSSDYVSEGDIKDVTEVVDIEFIEDNMAGVERNFFPMTDRLSILGMAQENINPYILANNKRTMRKRFADIVPPPVIRKPIFGRDSIGVEIIDHDAEFIYEQYIVEEEITVCVFQEKGKIKGLGASISFDSDICSQEIKEQDKESYTPYKGQVIKTAIEVYKKMEWSERMVRFDFRGNFLIDVNAFGGIGKRGWMYQCFKTNGIKYEDYIKIVLKQD